MSGEKRAECQGEAAGILLATFVAGKYAKRAVVNAATVQAICGILGIKNSFRFPDAFEMVIREKNVASLFAGKIDTETWQICREF